MFTSLQIAPSWVVHLCFTFLLSLSISALSIHFSPVFISPSISAHSIILRTSAVMSGHENIAYKNPITLEGSLVGSLVESPGGSLAGSLVGSLVQSLGGSLVESLGGSLAGSLGGLLAGSLIESLISSLAGSLVGSFTLFQFGCFLLVCWVTW